MKKVVQVLALLVMGATAVSAEPQNMNMTPANVIDGSQTPEQIPISLALRFWLDTYTRSGKIRVPQVVGLSQADSAALLPLMTSHRTQFDAVVSAYNAAVDADAINGTKNADRTGFWNGYTDLTTNTWAQIQASLSAKGLAAFTAYLQKEKAGMKISAYDTGLGAVAKRNLAEAQMVATMSGMVPQGGQMTPNYSAYNAIGPSSAQAGEDDFGTNGSLSAAWVVRYGSFSVSNGNLSITGQGGASGADSVVYYGNGGTPYWAQCAIAVLGGVPGTNAIGPAVNISSSAETDYSAIWVSTGINFYKMLNGTQTVLGGHAYTPASGDELILCNDGAGNLTVNLNGNPTPILTAHDTSITSGYAGIRGNSVGSQNTATLTSYSGGGTLGLEINASESGDTICGYGGFCNSAIHTPSVQNYDSKRGGTNQGPGVSPQTYIDEYNDVDYPEADFTPGVDDPIYVGEEVICNLEGLFFSSGPSGTPSKYESENAIVVVGNTNVRDPSGLGWKVKPICFPDYAIPDLNLATIFPFTVSGGIPPAAPYRPYYKARTICWRTTPGGTWNCLLVDNPVIPAAGFQFRSLSAAQFGWQTFWHGTGYGGEYYCTNKDYAYDGLPYP
jgi:hypothetical protein